MARKTQRRAKPKPKPAARASAPRGLSAKPTKSAKPAKRVKPPRPTKKAPAGRSAQPPTSSSSSTSSIRDYCRSLPGTTEDIKWGNDLVFSVGGKMYAGFDVEDSDAVGFKCDDDDFDRLTTLGERAGGSIIPAPYAARFGWVAITRKGALPDAELRGLLRKSYDLVVAKLPARLKPAAGPRI